MALMTEERRKEMEEEMSRFELEISTPGSIKPTSNANDVLIGNKPLSPPPPPPAVAVLIPEVLVKAPPPPPPPPPPPSSPPPLHAVLRPPPPPPPPPPPVPTRLQSGPMRFIPHQLHRQPPRPTVRPNFVPMRGVPIGGPFPSPGIGPFVPPIAQAPPVGGPQIPGTPIPHIAPGPMPMPPAPMPMPPQMTNISVSLPMPPGFCPPTGPGPTVAPGTALPCETQPFLSSGLTQNFDTTESAPESTSESSTVVAAAPAVYAAPFVKSHAENTSDTLLSANGQENTTTSAGIVTKSDKQSYTKHDDQTVGPTAIPISNNEEIVVSKKKEKKKKIVRMAGGQAWEDNSLLEWDTDDFRIFCGDLGNDVTDEVLIRAFSKYPSFVKAKVIRDKRTNKTKGYGFVSFKDPQDFIKAMREMNGKYVGSRPIKLRKSTWRDRNIDIVKKKQREKEKLGLL